MISKLTGILDGVEENSVILDVGGVGFEVFCTQNTISNLPEVGCKVVLNIRPHVREDHIHLYGFFSIKEKLCFDHLIKVQGVGNKLALTILSVLSPIKLVQAIITKDSSQFVSVSGVGPKLASRLVTELDGKVSDIDINSEVLLNTTNNVNNQILDDAVSALVNLGYKRSVVYQSVSKYLSTSDEKKDLDIIIRATLKELSING